MDGIKVKALLEFFETYAPSDLKESYDNVGLLVGDENAAVKGVMVGLELTDDLIQETISKGYNTIVIHHPLIFRPLYKINEQDPIGARVIKLIRNQINLFAMHTNLDRTINGLNDYVCQKLGIKVEPFDEGSEVPLYRVGTVEKTTVKAMATHVKDILGLDYLHYVGDENKTVTRVGVCTGSGISLYSDMKKENVDVFITGDIKYHDATMALDVGIPIIDGTHYGTELCVGELLKQQLIENFSDVKIEQYGNYKNPIKTI